MHPILVAALAGDRHRLCLCAAVAQQRYGLCRECRAVAVWRKDTGQTRRRVIPNQACAKTAKARLFALVASLLHLISGKAEG